MKTFLKKYKIFLLVAVFAVFSLTLGISAAYTNVNKVKRVISTQGGVQTAFSSNYLTLVDKEFTAYDMKRIIFANTAESRDIEITVSNFPRDNQNIVNQNDIAYSFNVTLIDANGQAVSEYKGFSFSGPEDKTLHAGRAETHTYILTVPPSFVEENIKIMIEAVPAQTSHTDEKKLAKILTFTENSERTSAWIGAFQENTAEGYDGFNYEITGQGAGTLSLTWDPAKLEINKVFLNTYNLTPAETGGKSTVSWEVGSENGRYVVQFYKKEGVSYSDNAYKGYAELKFTPLSETQNSSVT